MEKATELLFTGLAIKQVGWWTKFKLLFVPTMKAVDMEGKVVVSLWYKRMGGVTYVVDVWYGTNGRGGE